MFTGPTANVLAISVQLQHLDIELEYNVIIADNGAPKSNETQKKPKLSFKHTSNNFWSCTLLHLILLKGV